MVHATTDAIIHADYQGTITFVNKAASSLFRYSEGELLGKPFTQLIPLRYRAAHNAEMVCLQATGIPKVTRKTVELRGLRKDGSEFPMEIYLSPRHNQEHIYYRRIIREITVRKEKQAGLRLLADQLRGHAKLLDLAHLMVRNLNDEIVYWNTGAAKLYGWTKSQAMGKISHHLLRTEFPIPLDRIKKTLMETGKWEGELIHTKQDGFPLVVASHWELYRDDKGEPLAILEVNNDITPVKHFEKCQHIRIDVNFFLSSAKNMKEATASILKHMCEIGKWDFAYLWRCYRQRGEMSCREGLWVSPKFSPLTNEAIEEVTRVPFELAIPPLIFKTGMPLWLSEDQFETASHSPIFADRGFREVFGFPIRNQKCLHGGIVFGSQMPDTPDPLFSESFSEVGIEIAQFIEHQIHDDYLRMLNECFLNFGHNAQTNINSLVDLSGKLFDAKWVTYGHLKEDHLYHQHQWGHPPHLVGFEEELSPIFTEINEAGRHRPVILGDLANSSYVQSESGILAHGIKSVIGGVVFVNGHPKARLILYLQWDSDLNDWDLKFFGILVGALAVEEERRNTEQILQQAYNDTKNFLSSLPGAVLVVNQDLRVTYGNNIANEFFSEDRGTIIGKYLREILPLGQTRWDQLTFTLSVSSKKKNPSYGPKEFELKNRSYHYRVFPLNIHSSDVSQMGLFIWDITREKDLQEHLIQSEKLIGLGTLVSGMAHEVNNPAQAIMTMGEVIQTSQDLNQIRDFAEDITSYAKHIGTVVQNFSSFARPSSLEGIQRVNVKERLVEAVRMVQLGKQFPRITVTYEFQEVPFLSVSQVEIDQVFINLIRNGMEAMEPSGVLTIRTQSNHNQITVLISDTGMGIPQELMGRIFNPFFTTKPPGKGTGLGLTIVHRIVTKYQGSIDVNSQEGRGTTFSLTFPGEIPEPLKQGG